MGTHGFFPQWRYQLMPYCQPVGRLNISPNSNQQHGFQFTHWEMNGWNAKITGLKRKIIFDSKPQFWGSMLFFQSVVISWSWHCLYFGRYTPWNYELWPEKMAFFGRNSLPVLVFQLPTINFFGANLLSVSGRSMFFPTCSDFLVNLVKGWSCTPKILVGFNIGRMIPTRFPPVIHGLIYLSPLFEWPKIYG